MNSTDTTIPGRPAGNHGIMFMVLVTLILPLGQVPLDFYSPALPTMRSSLHTTPALLQMSVTLFIICSGLSQIPIGAISNRFGRKKVLLTCVVGLLLSTLACGFAVNIEMLLIARAIEGLFAGVGGVISFSYAGDSFTGRQLTRMIGLIGMAWATVPVLAPAAGGVVVSLMGWRGNFWILAGMIALLGIIFTFALPETLPVERRVPIRPLRVVRTCLSILGNFRFIAYTLVFTLCASTQLLFVSVAPFLYQDKLGFTPGGFGLIALCVGAGNLIGNANCSVLAMKLKPSSIILLGYLLIICGNASLLASALFHSLDPTWISISIGITFIGCGTVCPTAASMSVDLYPGEVSLASGLINTTGLVGIGITTGLASKLHLNSQMPLALLYIGLTVAGGLLFLLARLKTGPDPSPGVPQPGE